MLVKTQECTLHNPLMATPPGKDTWHTQPLLPSVTTANSACAQRPQRRSSWQKLAIMVILACFTYSAIRLVRPKYYLESFRQDNDEACPQATALVPTENAGLWDQLNAEMATEGFKNRAVEWLGGAVRVPTESFDGMGPIGEDSRWDAFQPFHSYLLDAFPLVHTSLKLTKVNTYGLLYEWVGSDASLKPLLLAAHQDVVPVDPSTVDQWTHPPYSGFYDGERLWGRGSSDDKSGLIGILSSVETLLGKGFKPVRTVVLAFGFDEEASGFQGAGRLATALKDAYGENGIAMIMDEGAGFYEQYGSFVANVGIAEKGFINVRVEVKAPGGHSSIPPPHTSIGMLSALLVHIEDHPSKVLLDRSQPVYATIQCVGEHAQSVPDDFRKLIKKASHSDKALMELQSILFKQPVLKSLVGTTQAIDLIQGGVKSNALPEQAWAVVNHRITVTGSTADLRERDAKLLKPLAERFNLTYRAFGSHISPEGAPSSGSLTLSDLSNTSLEPAPVTPTGQDAIAYQVLSGTIKATFNAYRQARGESESGIIVAPSMMSGNTDTRFYWDLTKNIFRYNHHRGSSENPLADGIHTVNESIDVDAFVEMIQFFTTLILNADESTTL